MLIKLLIFGLFRDMVVLIRLLEIRLSMWRVFRESLFFWELFLLIFRIVLGMTMFRFYVEIFIFGSDR